MAKPVPWLKPGLLIGGTVPGAFIAFHAARGTLAADPIAEALNRFGLLALVFLIASLTCTPLKTLFGWTWPMRIRRMLGLFAFSYASLHVVTYAVVDQVLNLRAIAEDIVQRRFILVGFLAYVLLVPLAITSTNGWVKRLGYARWQRLHRLVYAAALLAATHFVWRVKQDLTEPAIYASILLALLAVRLFGGRAKRALSPSPSGRGPG